VKTGIVGANVIEEILVVELDELLVDDFIVELVELLYAYAMLREIAKISESTQINLII
jgi:hypothetical protein